MADYELFAPDDATMQTALSALGVRATNSGKVGTTVFATDYYGTKYVQSGTVISSKGITIPNMVAQSGLYCNIRWMGASVLTLAANITSLGATIKLQASPIYRVFA